MAQTFIDRCKTQVTAIYRDATAMKTNCEKLAAEWGFDLGEQTPARVRGRPAKGTTKVATSLAPATPLTVSTENCAKIVSDYVVANGRGITDAELVNAFGNARPNHIGAAKARAIKSNLITTRDGLWWPTAMPETVTSAQAS